MSSELDRRSDVAAYSGFAGTASRKLDQLDRPRARARPGSRLEALDFRRHGIAPGHFFGTSAELWLNLQKLCELRLAKQKSGTAIARLPTLDAGGGLHATG